MPHKSNTPGKLIGDHAGHLIADLFGGSPLLDNLVSQIGNSVNQSSFARLEKLWKKSILKQEKKITELKIKVNYDGNGLRPRSFDIEYIIDGNKVVVPTINN